MVLDLLPAGSGILPNPVAAAANPPAGNPAVGPDGHRVENRYREPGFGSVTTITHLPVKGTSPSRPPPIELPSRSPPFELSSRIPEPRQFSTYRFQSSSGPSMYTASGKLPKVPFPKFTGENPKLWQSRSERYFDMHGIDKSVWVPVATMYFDDAAARWLQSVESKVSSIEWEDFCKLVHDRFGRDQQIVDPTAFSYPSN